MEHVGQYKPKQKTVARNVLLVVNCLLGSSFGSVATEQLLSSY